MKWVVYFMSLYKKPPMKAVCDQREWDAMETAHPGYHKLIKAGIPSEGEAEAMARVVPVPKLPIWAPSKVAPPTE